MNFSMQPPLPPTPFMSVEGIDSKQYMKESSMQPPLPPTRFMSVEGIDSKQYMKESSMQPPLPPTPFMSVEGIDSKQMGSRPKKAVNAITPMYCDTCSLKLNSQQQAECHFTGKAHLKRLRALGMPMPQGPDGACVAPIKRSKEVVPKGDTAPTGGDDPVAKAILMNATGQLPTKRKLEQIPCDLCACRFVSQEQADVHFSGAKHQKRLRTAQSGGMDAGASLEGLILPSSSAASASLKANAQRGGHFCRFCNISVNSLEQMEKHNTGTKHLRRMKAADESGVVLAPPENCAGGNNSGMTPAGEMMGRVPGQFYCATCNISVFTAAKLQQHVKTDIHRERSAAKAAEENGASYAVAGETLSSLKQGPGW